MADSIVTLRTYTDSFIANIDLAKLSNAGIPSFLENNEDVLINPGIMNLGKIKLKINASDTDKAIEILNQE